MALCNYGCIIEGENRTIIIQCPIHNKYMNQEQYDKAKNKMKLESKDIKIITVKGD